jgi:hypothetical protein
LPPADAPAAAEPSFFSVDMLPLAELLPLAAESSFFSVAAGALPDALPCASVLGFCSWVVVLPDALPDALPWASVLGFCSWLIDGVWPACDSCFFSCATALSDSNAAATATAMGLNLMRSPLLGNYRSVTAQSKGASFVPSDACPNPPS